MYNKLKTIVSSIIGSYSQIFFSSNKIFAILLMFVSFFDFWAGISGLFAVVVTNLIAYFFGFNKTNIKNGYYAFNSLLVGLGTGLLFYPSFKLIIIIFLLSVLTLFICLALEGVLTKYGLPFLSIPFLFSIWL